MSIPQQGLFVPFARVGSSDLCKGLTSISQQGLFVPYACVGSGDLCEGLTSIPQQGLFVPFARVGSSDPVRVLCLFHNKYSLSLFFFFVFANITAFILLSYIHCQF